MAADADLGEVGGGGAAVAVGDGDGPGVGAGGGEGVGGGCTRARGAVAESPCVGEGVGGAGGVGGGGGVGEGGVVGGAAAGGDVGGGEGGGGVRDGDREGVLGGGAVGVDDGEGDGAAGGAVPGDVGAGRGCRAGAVGCAAVVVVVPAVLGEGLTGVVAGGRRAVQDDRGALADGAVGAGIRGGEARDRDRAGRVPHVAVVVGDVEACRPRASGRVRVARGHARASGAVAECPGVRRDRAVRVIGCAPVESDGEGRHAARRRGGERGHGRLV